MLSTMEITKQQRKMSVQELLKKVKDTSIVPKFHLEIAECLLVGYPLKNNIICIDMETGYVFYGREILETIFYLDNNGIVESNFFPNLNKKSFSELHPSYQRRVMERYVDVIEWRCNEENMKYLKKIYCETNVLLEQENKKGIDLMERECYD